MARLILINGPPGVGKSTIAARYAAEHPGILVCDIDVLRGFVSSWEADYADAGARIRPAALGLVSAYLRESGDVVLPQLLAREEELDRFVRAGTDVGAEVVEVLLTADADVCVRRFAARDLALPHDRVAQTVVDSSGGVDVLRGYHQALADLTARRPWTRVIETREGDVAGTYAALLAAVT